MNWALGRVMRVTLLVAVVLVMTLIRISYAQDHHRNDHAVEPATKDNQQSALPLRGKKVVFELTDRDGKLVTAEDYRGNYLLMAFGFTQCTHVCPAIAATMARVLTVAKKPAMGIFISVDTERDGAKITDDYARGFHPEFMGLSGSYAQLARAASEFQATFVVTKSQKNYTVQHTAYIYLIDQQGKIIDVFAQNEPVDNIIAAMR